MLSFHYVIIHLLVNHISLRNANVQLCIRRGSLSLPFDSIITALSWFCYPCPHPLCLPITYSKYIHCNAWPYAWLPNHLCLLSSILTCHLLVLSLSRNTLPYSSVSSAHTVGIAFWLCPSPYCVLDLHSILLSHRLVTFPYPIHTQSSHVLIYHISAARS